MAFELSLARKVQEALDELAAHDQRKYRRVLRCLGLLEQDPTYPSLSSHPYQNVKGPHGETIWESYVENNTPSAWRVWWYYGPGQREITVFDLGPHP